MILRRDMVPVLARRVALSTVTLLFYSAVARAPAAFIGDDDMLLLTPPEGGLTSTGSISATLAEMMRSQPGVRAVSPEIFIPTSIAGQSAIVRAVETEPFLSMEGGTLTQGRLPIGGSEGLAGAGFLDAHDKAVGDVLVLTGSIAGANALVRIVGAFEADGPPRDELLISIETGRHLAQLSGDGVHLLRVDAANRSAIASLIDSVTPVFAFSDVRISEDIALVGDTLVVEAKLTNWGSVGGTKLVEVRESGRVLASAKVYVPPRAIVPVSVPFVVDQEGSLNITINPTFEVRASRAAGSIEARNVAGLGAPFELRVIDLQGSPIANATVEAQGATGTTDADGRVVLVPSALGAYHARAFVNGTPIATWKGYVVAAGDEDHARKLVLGVSTTTPLVRANQTVTVNVRVANLGGRPDTFPVNLTLDGVLVAELTIPLDPAQEGTASAELPLLPPGVHEVRADGRDPALLIESLVGDPTVEAILRANRASAERGPSLPEVDAGSEDYISRVIGNVRLAVAVLSIVSAGLASLGAIAVLGRHIADRAPALGLLKAVGGDREYALRVVAREAGKYAAIATLIGLAVGCAIAWGIDATGYLRAFGHQVRPRFDPYVLLLLGGGSILFIVVAARALAAATFARPVDQLLRGESLRRGRTEAPRLADLLEARP